MVADTQRYSFKVSQALLFNIYPFKYAKTTCNIISLGGSIIKENKLRKRNTSPTAFNSHFSIQVKARPCTLVLFKG